MQLLLIHMFCFVIFLIDHVHGESHPPREIEKIQWPGAHLRHETNNTQPNDLVKTGSDENDHDAEKHDHDHVLILGNSNADHGDHHHHLHTKDPKKRLIKHGTHTHTVEEAEKDGGYIISILFGVMLLAQVLLYAWKKYHPHSFQNVTLLGLWIIPFGWSVFSKFWIFLSVWSIFSIMTVFVIQRARRIPLKPRTPRMVYYWFFLIYKLCYGTAVVGYLLVMCEFLRLDDFFPMSMRPLLPLGVRLLFYGLYFGVLGRDCAVLCASRMASTIGYKAKDDSLPTKHLASGTCAICDTALPSESSAQPQDEKIFALNCGHKFHESCIRGWVIVGKKDTCAYCSEHVRLQDVFNAPWEKHSIAWSVVLDSLRYLIVFNPIICIMMQLALFILY